LLSVLMFWL